MKTINQIITKPDYPVKVLQFGEGNFLRAFVDYMIDIANEKELFGGSVQIIKSINFGSIYDLKAQDGLYTVLLRGIRDGATYTEKRVVTSVAGAAAAYDEYEDYAAFARCDTLRFIVSNTTEAGIVYDGSDDIALTPPKSYPGKLTKFLYERFRFFDGDLDKGLIILPVELIDKNGQTLKECCLKLTRLWRLPEEFTAWMLRANLFCNTLVDRIVTGFPKDEATLLEEEWGYSDKLMVTGEPFALWVIESADPKKVAGEFPLEQAGLPVIFTRDLTPYRERKVRILNGAHTASVLAAFLSGIDTVGEMMKDEDLRPFLEAVVYDELAPLVPLPLDEVRAFAASVMERFENPFIQHNLLSIALNSVAKFKARVLPTILETHAKSGALPTRLCFSMAALIAFYRGKKGEGKLIGDRDGCPYDIIDDTAVLSFFVEHAHLSTSALVNAFLRRVDFWGEDISLIPGLTDTVNKHLESIEALGMREAVNTNEKPF